MSPLAIRLALACLSLMLADHAALAALSSTATHSLESNRLGLALGRSVSTAGDVNGDGFSDLVVGSDGATANGAAFQLYLGRASGSPFEFSQLAYAKLDLPSSVDVAACGDVNGDGRDDVAIAFGSSLRVYPGSAAGLDTVGFFAFTWAGLDPISYAAQVAPAGDVNGDGYDDVLLHSPAVNGSGACSGTNNGAIMVFYGSASGLSSANSITLCGGAANRLFGFDAHGAGDVNGDGYDDVLVGVPGGDPSGQAKLFLGSGSGLQGSAITTLTGDQVGGQFGLSVGPAGDVNGDGYADVIVGAPNRDLSPGSTVDAGAAYVFLGGSGGLSTSVHWTANGAFANARFGAVVRTAGDIDGDGYAEIAVGSPGHANPESNEGSFAVYSGSSTGVRPLMASSESNRPAANLGASLTSAGDVNGDGFGDLIVGAPYWTNGQSLEGAVFVYYGAADAPDPTTPAGTWFGFGDSNRLGWSVGGAGDFNNDGLQDMVIGEVGYDDGSTDGGRIHLHLGSTSGLPFSPNRSFAIGSGSGNLGIAASGVGDTDGDGIDDLVAGAHVYGGVGVAVLFRGNTGAQLTVAAALFGANQTDEYLGAAISPRGDLNGDGYADVAVGAPGWDGPAGADQGRVYIWFGRAGGIAGFPVADVILEGTQAGERFGGSVALVSDLDRDGTGDLAVGSPGFDAPAGMFTILDTGRIRIYRGLRSAPWVSIIHESHGSSQAQLGSSITDAGDLNGDGYSDVVAGAPFQANVGGIRAVYGGPAGPISVIDQTAVQSFSGFGASVSGAGDINADGYTDVVVGATFHEVTLQDEGQMSVYLGGPFGLAATPFWTKPGGQAFANIGHVVAGVGDVNGDGLPDVAGGAPGYNNAFFDEGYVQVFLANGGGRPRLDYMRQTVSGARIPHLGMSGSDDDFTMYDLVTSAAGRTRGWYDFRLERTAFGDALPLFFAPFAYPMTDLFPPYGWSVLWPQPVSNLDGGVPYAWIGRNRAREPYFPTSPWIQPGLNGRRIYDLRTSPGALDAPIATAAERLELAAPSPNPSRGPAALSFALTREGTVSLAVHDLQGRLVRQLATGTRAAGVHRVTWDGRDAGGSTVRAGIYFVRLVSPEGTRETRLVRLD